MRWEELSLRIYVFVLRKTETVHIVLFILWLFPRWLKPEFKYTMITFPILYIVVLQCNMFIKYAYTVSHCKCLCVCVCVIARVKSNVISFYPIVLFNWVQCKWIFTLKCLNLNIFIKFRNGSNVHRTSTHINNGDNDLVIMMTPMTPGIFFPPKNLKSMKIEMERMKKIF